MTVPVVTFFNNNGRLGKTSVVYNLAWMLAEQGHRVVAADLDPQSNLTTAFLDEEASERIWPSNGFRATVCGSISPLLRDVGDMRDPELERINERIVLLAGDLTLSAFEDELSSQWLACLDGKERAFRVISAFWRLLMRASDSFEADLVLVDIGPNLDAINRAALVATDHIVVPLTPDLFSVQGLQNLGPVLQRWREEWSQRVPHNPDREYPLPSGRMEPLGYVLLQRGIRKGEPVQAYQRWMDQVPDVYREAVLRRTDDQVPNIADDRECLAHLRHYYSLTSMAQEAHKPVFALKPADGAFGGHQAAVKNAYEDYSGLARALLERITDSGDV